MMNSPELARASSQTIANGGRNHCEEKVASSDTRLPVQIVYIVAAGKTANLLMKGQLAFLRSQGYEITIVASPSPHLHEVAQREGVNVVPIPISRTIRPLHDILTLYRLWRYLRKARPDVVNASTPKAGLLGMLSAFMCRIPVRIYTLRGLRLETTSGVQRLVLGICERISSWCSHRVVCVSQSLATEYSYGRYAPSEKIIILGEGSSNGVDSEKFSPLPGQRSNSQTLRNELGIPDDAVLLGFVGRMTRDKGIAELVEVFEQLSSRLAKIHLVIVGEYEPGDAVDTTTRARIRHNPRIHLTGFVTETVRYYRILDVLLFPSYREGFPNAVIEAQATGLPVVGYAATGTIDAVREGETGKLVKIGDINGLCEAVETYVIDPMLRQRHGKSARERVMKSFRREKIWQMLDSLYSQELKARCANVPADPAVQSSTAADIADAA